MSAVLFVLLSLGVFRVWRLLGRDDITEPMRIHLPNGVLKLVTCPWCLGSWLSIAAVLLFHFHVQALGPNVWLWVAAVAAAVGLIGEADRKLLD